MRILHINHSDSVGGAAIASLRISESLSKMGVVSNRLVRLKIGKNPNVYEMINKPFGRLINIIRWRFGYLICYIFNQSKDATNSLNVIPSFITRKINNLKPDIVHLHWIGHETLSFGSISKITQPIVWTMHDLWPISGAEHISFNQDYLNGYKRKTRRIFQSNHLNKWVLNRKRKLYNKKKIFMASPSTWLAKKVKESSIFNDLTIKVIPNPLDTNFWIPINKEDARKQLKLPINKKIILFGLYGDIHVKHKGFDLLVDAFSELKYDKSKILIVTFGGENQKSLKPLGFETHNFGFISENKLMRNIYSAADVYVMPSRIESFGQTAAESSACGTPVVAFNDTGVADIVQHKKTGWLAKYKDTSDLSRGIDFLLENSSLDLFSKNARTYIVNNFSYPVVANQYLDYYRYIFSKN